MNTIEKVDTALGIFDSEFKALTLNELMVEFEKAGLPTDKYSFGGIMDILINDGYVAPPGVWRGSFDRSTPVYQENVYRITVKGILFREQHGYKGEAARREAESKRLENLENAQQEYNSNMLWLTWVLAIAAVVGALYYLKELTASPNLSASSQSCGKRY